MSNYGHVLFKLDENGNISSAMQIFLTDECGQKGFVAEMRDELMSDLVHPHDVGFKDVDLRSDLYGEDEFDPAEDIVQFWYNASDSDVQEAYRHYTGDGAEGWELREAQIMDAII